MIAMAQFESDGFITHRQETPENVDVSMMTCAIFTRHRVSCERCGTVEILRCCSQLRAAYILHKQGWRHTQYFMALCPDCA